MTIDKPITSGSQLSDELQRELLEMECEGAVVVPPIDHLEEVERLCAADLIRRMRRVREESPRWSEVTREQFARRFEQLSLEAAAAASWLRRFRADDDVPEWLRSNGAA
jgi:hypothetical protein